MSDIELTTLENGLRIITNTVESAESVALGIWSHVGTRNENMQHNGVAHMVEHMLFKGTKTRNTRQIAESVENVGGHMNAYTSREATSYHVQALKEHASLALEILADMYQHSTMPDEEVERERHVVLQEIGMAYDTPDDLVFDNYYETAYPDQAIGAPILGKEHNIKSMTRDIMLQHIETFYHGGRTILSAAGNIGHDEFVRMVTQHFSSVKPSNDALELKKAAYSPSENRLDKELEQSHIILGFEGIPRTDPDYYTAQALSILLGGGMSSRLFQEIREKRGLVYSIYAFHSSYADNGQFGIYAGTGPNDLPELVPVMCDEIMDVLHNLSDEEISRTKAQLKSNLLMSRESMMTRADQQAKFLMYHNKILDIQTIIQKIENMEGQDLKNVARRIFSSAPNLAALGPLSKLESYESIKGRLKA